MKIVFTFEWDVLQVRAIDWYNSLSFLGHEVYLLNPTDYAKRVFEAWKTKVNYVTDDNFIDGCDLWFYDMSPIVWNAPPRLEPKMRTFKGQLACINFEDGYNLFESLIDQYLRDKTSIFIGNAFFHPSRERYNGTIVDKLMLTTGYITNSQAFKNTPPVSMSERKKRVYFSGALTGFPSSLTGMNKAEYRLRYTMCKLIADSGIDHIVRFTGCDPDLKEYYDVVPSDWKKPHIYQHEYVKEFTESLFCLAVKGNSFPTNRFHESQAARCITLTNPLHVEAEFYGTGTAGVDYVEIDVNSESDIIEKVKYYIEHEAEAAKIIENGRRNWELYNMLDDNNAWSEHTMKYHVNGLKAIGGIDITKV